MTASTQSISILSLGTVCQSAAFSKYKFGSNFALAKPSSGLTATARGSMCRERERDSSRLRPQSLPAGGLPLDNLGRGIVDGGFESCGFVG